MENFNYIKSELLKTHVSSTLTTSTVNDVNLLASPKTWNAPEKRKNEWKTLTVVFVGLNILFLTLRKSWKSISSKDSTLLVHFQKHNIKGTSQICFKIIVCLSILFELWFGSGRKMNNSKRKSNFSSTFTHHNWANLVLKQCIKVSFYVNRMQSFQSIFFFVGCVIVRRIVQRRFSAVKMYF